MKGLSVIICCHNSDSRLPETLKHIAFQQFKSNLDWELIIVNNASEDDTESVAKNEWNKYNVSNVKFSIVNELTPGLIYARKKGIDLALYEYIIFCDDDNWLMDNYLQNAFDIMESNPNIGALGGKGEGVTLALLPEWWEVEKGSYAVGTQSESSGCLNMRGYLWGAGLVVRKDIIDIVFDFKYPFLLIGRKENLVISGDDFEICSRILLLGYDLFYSETLLYKHFIDSYRLNDEYHEKLNRGFSLISTIQNKYRMAINYSTLEFNEKFLYLLKRLIIVFLSGFQKRRIEQLREFLIFGFLFKMGHNQTELSIYNFIKNTRNKRIK